MDANPSFELRPLSNGDGVGHLKLGDEAFTPLKRYLKKDAKAHQAASLARTYAFFKDGSDKVCAYMTIICGEIEVSIEHDEGVDYPYTRYPAIKIARLAVDNRIQKAGLGRRLFELGLAITREIICPNVGCRFMVVDSKQQSIKFYEKCGFTMIDTPENKAREHPVMFIDLHKTADA